MRILRSVRSVIRAFDPSLDGEGVTRAGTHLVVFGDGRVELRMFLQSREVWGTWIASWLVTPSCFYKLKRDYLIESINKASDMEVFVLSAEGQKRLRKT